MGKEKKGQPDSHEGRVCPAVEVFCASAGSTREMMIGKRVEGMKWGKVFFFTVSRWVPGGGRASDGMCSGWAAWHRKEEEA